MTKQNEIDPHEILEIEPGASRPEIEHAYYLARLAYGSESLASYSLYSPREKTEILERIDQAYRILTNQEPGAARTGPDPGSPSPRAPSLGEPLLEGGGETPSPASEEKTDSDTYHRATPAAEQPARPAPRGRTPLRPMPARPRVEASEVSRPYNALALRKVRESRGLSIEEISQRTKISLKNLRSIESGDYDDLPPVVYLKGHLTEYSKCLRLHPEHVTEDFLAAAAGRDGDGASGKRG